MAVVMDRSAAQMGKTFVEQLISNNWRDIYVGTRRIHRFREVAQFPNTTLPGMELSFSVDYITVRYGEEHYTISFEINKKTGKPEDFIFSSNWNLKPELLVETHKTFLQHLVALAKIGVV